MTSTTPSAAWSSPPSATCRNPARSWRWAASTSGSAGRMRAGSTVSSSACMPMPERLAGRLAVLLLLCLLPALAAAAPRIGVLTMEPGELFFERFGHNAIVVDTPGTEGPIAYNFGYFDLDEPGITDNFIRGKMRYWLVALPMWRDLAYYRQAGRGVTLQWLDLTPEQATGLARRLAERARGENARYDYDYFTSNCSTQVRDALNQALDG